MKKVLLLICGIFLLFPAAIYLGNLAGYPEAKRVMVYFQDFAGMPAAEETPPAVRVVEKIPVAYAQLGLVESWRNLAAGGFSDILQIIGTPDIRNSWQANAGDFLGDALHSEAFFSSSWSFWQMKQDKLSLIGYYQPWIDVLLLVQVAEVNGNYQAIAIRITEPNSAKTGISVTLLAQELTARLQRAEQAFQAAVDHPNTITAMLKPEATKKSQDVLNQYVAELRGKLVANSAGNQAPAAILSWLDAVRTEQIKAGVLTQQSSGWLKQLQPVQLTAIDPEHWLLAAVSRNQAERILLVQLQVKEQKAQATELQIWDAATAGGVQ